MSPCCANKSVWLCLLIGLCWTVPAQAAQPGEELWSSPRRGSWRREGATRPGDVVLVPGSKTAPAIVVPRGENSFVRRAAAFLAGDIARITGVTPVIVAQAPAPGGPTIVVSTAPAGSDPRWEAYDVTVGANRVRIRGSNPRGTAFGVYELCERIGVDPLYLWTGFTPQKALPLVLQPVQFSQKPPATKFRGLFHDDEDIVVRPFLAGGIPDREGTVPLVWYERFFETALRLRLNLVAPWVRVDKYFAVQKTASDWGLFYTSHHYDTLLSDPYHFTRGVNLAQKRGVKPVWDWLENREGLLRFWRGGVEENKSLHCIWPIGMRGTEDYGYRFPADWSEARRAAAFSEALRAQTDLVPLGSPERFFHFTMYTEMLPLYQSGALTVPKEAIIVWPDDNDGVMRGLPDRARGAANRHGVYYHLAYFGGGITKQTHQTVPLGRIENEFRKITTAGATEFCLVNVSEVREFVLGTRFLADICWQGTTAFVQPDAAGRFLRWWCREYFGEAAAPLAVQAYNAYFALLPHPALLAHGAEKSRGAIASLQKKFNNEAFAPALPDTLPTLQTRFAAQTRLLDLLGRARSVVPEGEPQTFFFENLELAAAIDRLPTEAAILLVRALNEPDQDKARALSLRALPPLDELDLLLRRAERSPFENWYGPSWIAPRQRTLILPRRELTLLLRSLEGRW